MSKKRNSKKFNSSRRDFLKYSGGCSALASTSAMSQLISLAMTQQVAAAVPQDEYKAIICLFLSGGNDSYNMLMPYEVSEHADYAAVRTAVAISRNQLTNTAITDPNSGKQYAFHPNMQDCQQMYNSGNLACVANVGSLVEPATTQQYLDRRRNDLQFPVGLFSHDDHQRAWQTAVPQTREGLTGWAGRCADLVNDTTNTNPALSICYSLDGENTMISGLSSFPYVLNEFSGANVMNGYGGGNRLDRIMTRSHDSLTNATYANLLVDTFANKKFTAVNSAVEYNESTDVINFNTPFPNNTLGRELEQIMKTIAVQEALGQTRQIFYVSEGNWDHHGDFNQNHPPQIQKVNDVLRAVHDTIIEIGAEGKVLLFMASDFARTLTFNGSGTDHAWGGNMLLLGPGVVNGGRVYGTYPESLITGNNLDIGRGRIFPTTSVDEYYMEIAAWFGIDPASTEMAYILPNLSNFWSSGQSFPLGMIS